MVNFAQTTYLHKPPFCINIRGCGSPYTYVDKACTIHTCIQSGHTRARVNVCARRRESARACDMRVALLLVGYIIYIPACIPLIAMSIICAMIMQFMSLYNYTFVMTVYHSF